jgi:membrane-bound ClpP family serine protease
MDPIYWALGLLVIGLLLVILEVFIPSGGVLGVLSAMAIIGAVVVAFTGGVRSGAIVLGLTAVLVPLVLSVAVKYWPHSPLGRLILIKLPKSDREILPIDEWGDPKQLVGRLGRAKSKMLPGGVVVIERRKYDAVSHGAAIEPGQVVKVVGVRNGRIVVRPSDEPLADEPAPQPVKTAEAESEADLLSQPIDALGLESLDDPLA